MADGSSRTKTILSGGLPSGPRRNSLNFVRAFAVAIALSFGLAALFGPTVAGADAAQQKYVNQAKKKCKKKKGQAKQKCVRNTANRLQKEADQRKEKNNPGVTIRTTEYGIPRIVADSFRGLGFGHGFALARENICSMADIYTTVRGERSKYFGPNGTYEGGTNLDSDFFYKRVIAEGTVNKLLSLKGVNAVKPEVREMIAGYVKGYNRYLDNVGVANLPDETCKGEPWVKKISESDAYMRFYQLVIYGSSGALIPQIANSQPPAGVADAGDRTPASAPIETEESEVYTDFENAAMGSNAVGLGSESTSTGKGMLFGNPHFPWTGQRRFFESQLTIPGKLNVSGGSLIGSPVVLIGHTGTLAWSHTVSTARRFATIYLELKPGDPTTYRMPDGTERKVKATTVDVQVKQEDGSLATESRTLYSTEFGPVITSVPGAPAIFTWTNSRIISLLDPNAESFRVMNHFLGANRSKSVSQLASVLKNIQGVPWVNTIAADSTGKALYSDIGVVPNINDEKVAECIRDGAASPYAAVWNLAQVATLDGTRNGCQPTKSPEAVVKGILPVNELPLQIRDDYTSNMNDSFWLSNPEAPITGIPRIVGNTDSTRSLRTRNGLTQVAERLAGTDGQEGDKFTLPQVQSMLTNGDNYGAELLLDQVVTYCTNNPVLAPTTGDPVDVSAACAALASYGATDTLDDPGAVLWRRIAGRLSINSAATYTNPFDLQDPVNTPNGLNTSATTLPRAIADTVKEFQAATPPIPFDAELRDYQFVTKKGERIPVPGGPGELGVYNAMSMPRNATTGEYTSVSNGTSFVINASLTGAKCPEVRTLLTYSQAATNEASPYYDDQTRLYSEGGWVVDRFCSSQQTADPNLKVRKLNGGAKSINKGGW
jgi:acyl-homoserine-lactone acylase